MSDSKNLRPYYDSDTFDAGYSVKFKPGVGLIDTETNKSITSSLQTSIINQASNRTPSPGRGIGINAMENGFSRSLSDKNYVYDLELQEYFDTNNLSELFKNLIWSFFKNYCKTLFMQPLEMVRLVLQVGRFNFDSKDKEKAKLSNAIDLNNSVTLNIDSDSDSEINYFQSNNDPISRPKAEKKSSKLPMSSFNRNKLNPISKHTVDILYAIFSQDGPFALFRGINASFIYQTLSHTIEAWITGFASPFLGIPDPFFLDLAHSTNPLRSMWLSITASVLTGLILMPLDLIKVRLMITHFMKPSSEFNDNKIFSGSSETQSGINKRSIRSSIVNYPIHYLIHPPVSVSILTVLYQFTTSIFRKGAPYIFFIRYNIDTYTSPNLFTIVNLLSLLSEFFIKLPVENILRKEQIKFLLEPKPDSYDEMKVLSIDNPEDDLIVEFNSGWDEYESESITLLERFKKLALFDGWRVGVLNVVGFWGYNILNSDGSYLKAERL